ncbi:hypothetical protein IW140_005073 [Coemansia sp. RSA 1813]|nr:hypothetical protein EV178_002195 [Coemansia sp. RSA 1646]KAJ1769264.1 hypothetical protein LPJ74_004201 [Coemansia sp. RSA 1843]KAJ2090304.1 hypothetical protein IW138_002730 [Coemansia sp. RSA 986]KAJ2215494.1 hypothetical protein EV179_002087 [Coemansia sp. RSA 487]KAJ2566090.1 hypothetical protein IW140_005073 [Coemansia sp. RSA 1813]
MVAHGHTADAWQQSSADPDAQPQDARQRQQRQNQQSAAPSSTSATVSYAPIQPRGNPDVHRQALAEENEMQQSRVLSERRRRNTQAAARMRERQRERERNLMQRRDELMARMNQLEGELAAIRTQRREAEADAVNEDYDMVLSQLSSELEAANTAMHQIIDEVEKLVDIVKSIDV